MNKLFWFLIYRIFGYYLPKSSSIFIGKFTRSIRYFLAKRIFKSTGKNVNLEYKAKFGLGQSIIIGDNSGIGVNARIPSNTIIGNNVMMGPDCLILPSNHRFDDINVPMIFQGFTISKQTIIKDDVWIGARVTILPGKVIGNGVVIGAGSVVTRDLEDFGIYGGNPARLIRFRNNINT